MFLLYLPICEGGLAAPIVGAMVMRRQGTAVRDMRRPALFWCARHSTHTRTICGTSGGRIGSLTLLSPRVLGFQGYAFLRVQKYARGISGVEESQCIFAPAPRQCAPGTLPATPAGQTHLALLSAGGAAAPGTDVRAPPLSHTGGES